MPLPDALRHRPIRHRSAIARGLKAGTEELPAVDPKGGDEGAGIIRGMAIITRGEALGHGLWIDSVMLAQVNDAITAAGDKGVKARFTHPDLSGDGLGKFTGRVKNSILDGDVVRGDLHFSRSSHNTPDGDLAGYLMQLAVDDPEAFGNSIAFMPDFDAEDAFILENGGFEEFQSPDPDNEKNLPHERMDALHAVDAVDSPAANPSGLFHRGQGIVQQAEAFVDYALGFSTERPELVQFDIDPERAAGFMARYLARRNLTLSTKDEATMPSAKLTGALSPNKQHGKGAAGTKTHAEGTAPGSDKEDKKEGDEPAGETDDEDKKEGDETTKQSTDDAPVEDPKKKDEEAKHSGPGAKFLSAFGDQGGIWYAQGKTFEEAQVLYTRGLEEQNKQLTAANVDLTKKLGSKAVASRGEETPLSSGGNPPTGEKKKFQGLSEGLTRFASALKLPTSPSNN